MDEIKKYLNKIVLDDCIKFMELLPDKSVDLVFTDVPYKQEFHGRGLAKERPNYSRIHDYGSNQFLNYDYFFELCLKKLKKANIFTFCNKETKFDFISMAKKFNLNYQELCFCKTSPTPFCNNQWLCDVEFGVHIFKNIPVLGDYSTKRSFFIMPNFKEEKINHPSAKKVCIIEKLLKNITSKEYLILDPFSGSGTTAVACHNLGLNFIAVEKDINYHKLSVERFEILLAQQKLFHGGYYENFY